MKHSESQTAGLARIVLHTSEETTPFLMALIGTLENLGYDEQACSAIHLACDEAITNAIRHGNCSDPRKCVDVRYRCDLDEFLIRIEDEGAGFDPESVPDPTLAQNLELPHGRGLLLMRSFMEKVQFEEKGTVVVMSLSRAWKRATN